MTGVSKGGNVQADQTDTQGGHRVKRKAGICQPETPEAGDRPGTEGAKPADTRYSVLDF